MERPRFVTHWLRAAWYHVFCLGAAPALAPSPTAAPTAALTYDYYYYPPTAAPTTPSPTEKSAWALAPTSSPTVAPTSYPTAAPTPSPTAFACRAGQFVNTINGFDLDRHCSVCPAGQYQPSRNIATSCLICPSGKYAEDDGITWQNHISCIDCLGGASAPTGSRCCQGYGISHDSSKPNTCVECPQGTFAAKNFTCIVCAAGKYTNAEKSTSCTDCPPGRFQRHSGRTMCYDCPPGFVSDGIDHVSGQVRGSQVCTACPAGKFRSSLMNCADCPAGRFQSSSGSSSCEACPPGRSRPQGFFAKDFTCIVCGANQYANAEGFAACLKCPAGRFIDDDGQADSHVSESLCSDCPVGYMSPYHNSGSRCSLCAPGAERNKNGACSICKAGWYSVEDTQCTPCPSGRYIPESASSLGEHAFESACLPCPVGTAASSPNSTSCKVCSPGKYAEEQGSKECTACPAGTFLQDDVGNPLAHATKSLCQPCQIGRASNLSGSASCPACQAGRHSPGMGLTSCYTCLPGFVSDGIDFFGNATGDTLCSPCPAGKYGSTSTSCTDCPAGRYQSQSGKASCFPCPLGSVSDGVDDSSGHATGDGDTVCTACPAGTFSNNSVVCTTCSAGRYQNYLGKTNCVACPAGRSQSESGQRDCHSCSEGASSEEGAQACFKCPIGRHSSADGDACWIDVPVLTVFVVGFCIQCIASYKQFRCFRHRLHIEDVSLTGSRVTVTMAENHHLRMRCFESTPVYIWDAGHPLLNKPSYFYRISIVDNKRFQLLSADGKPLADAIESSRGSLMQHFPHELLNQNLIGLACLAGLTIQWILLLSLSYYRKRSDITLSFFLVVNVGSTIMGAIVAMAARLRYNMQPTIWQRRLQHFRRDALKNHPSIWNNYDDLKIDRGGTRGVNLSKVMELLDSFVDKIRERTAYYLADNIVKPLTEPLRLSYAELVGSHCLDYFVSHYWGTAFSHFVASLQHHGEGVRTTSPTLPTYWICFLSNSQWHIEDELGSGDWKQSSFYLALTHNTCRGTCMVLDAFALPLTRSWCLFEVLQTYKLNSGADSTREGLRYCTDRGVMGIGSSTCYDVARQLSRRLANLSVADASASNKDDEAMITGLVEQEGGMKQMDQFIKDNMLAALRAIQGQFCNEVREFEIHIDQGVTQEVRVPLEFDEEVSRPLPEVNVVYPHGPHLSLFF